jgi:peptidoglycan/LPS O-acetylase OafA/YrhL
MYAQPKRIEFLDSLRGLAALFVLLSHTIGAFEWPSSYFAVIQWPFLSIFFNGKEAVAMFFVLSGYVLSKPYVQAGPDTRPMFIPTFYLRRFFRIWPPWFFVFLISIIAHNYLFFQPATQPATTEWLNGFWQAKLTVPDFFRQCIFVLHDSKRQLLNQDWSLGVELKGSAMIPLLIVIARRKYVGFMLPLAVIFLLFVGTGQYYVSFIVGVLVAQYVPGWSMSLVGMGSLIRATILITGLGLYQGFEFAMKVFSDSPFAYKYGWVVTAIGCALILLSVFGSPTLQWILNSKPLVFLGRISYSLYLLQFIFIFCLLPPLVALLNQWGIIQPSVLCPLTMLASCATTIGCAAVMYRFVELPVINFSHRLTKKIQQWFQK